MRPDIVPGATLPDFELPDETGKRRRLSEIQGTTRSAWCWPGGTARGMPTRCGVTNPSRRIDRRGAALAVGTNGATTSGIA